jgi:hypothetical protein
MHYSIRNEYVPDNVTIPARQIAFSVDANFHGPSEGQYVAEYVLTFHNKGNTRVEVRKIELLARGTKAARPASPPPSQAHPLRRIRGSTPTGRTTPFHDPIVLDAVGGARRTLDVVAAANGSKSEQAGRWCAWAPNKRRFAQQLLAFSERDASRSHILSHIAAHRHVTSRAAGTVKHPVIHAPGRTQETSAARPDPTQRPPEARRKAMQCFDRLKTLEARIAPQSRVFVLDIDSQSPLSRAEQLAESSNLRTAS